MKKPRFSLIVHYNATRAGILGGLPPTDTEETDIDAQDWQDALNQARTIWRRVPKTGEQFGTCALLCEIQKELSPRLFWFDNPLLPKTMFNFIPHE